MTDQRREPGELEAEVLAALWAADGPLTAGDVVDALGDDDLAYNTVLTVVDILYRKGWLSRDREGRAYRYQPTVSREDYAADLMGEALEASTDRAGTLRRFAERIGPADAEQLREALGAARPAGVRRRPSPGPCSATSACSCWRPPRC